MRCTNTDYSVASAWGNTARGYISGGQDGATCTLQSLHLQLSKRTYLDREPGEYNQLAAENCGEMETLCGAET